MAKQKEQAKTKEKKDVATSAGKQVKSEEKTTGC